MSTITLPEAEAVEPSPPRRRFFPWAVTRHTYGVLGVMVFTFGLYLTMMVQGWRKLGYKSFDSVIFDQAIRGYSRFEAPIVPLKSGYAGLPADFIQLGDHFSPIYVFFAPLYWIWDDVRMLFVAQAVIYAVAAALIWKFTRRILGVGPAYLVALAFAVSWGLQSAMIVGYHELDTSVLLLAIALERLYAGRHLQALVPAGLLLLVKEEMGLLVAVLGVLFFIRGHRLWGAGVAFVGVVWSALAIKVFVPAFGGSSTQYWTYKSMGPGPASAAKHVLTQPLDVLDHISSTPYREQLLMWLLAVALGAYFLSPIMLLALPSLALRMLSDTPSYSMVHYQYNAPLMVILLMAGVDGVGRLAGWIVRLQERRSAVPESAPPAAEGDQPEAAPAPEAVVPQKPRAVRTRVAQGLVWTWLAGVLAVAVYGCISPTFPIRKLFEQDSWQQTSYERAAFAVVDQIPRGATVEADDAIGVLISNRTQQLRLPAKSGPPGSKVIDIAPYGAQYAVLGAPPEIIWPFKSRDAVMTLKQQYLDLGYEEIWQQDNVWLLRRRD
ncbi:DUF2079 domain-containing protein [Micromonospora sp. NPDC049523]|uniref:DUF2079 domain-containing protein n=1 Tax=Micromonospora sp. NPDC049523 TaxID=3155921 RepID=UPI00344635A5